MTSGAGQLLGIVVVVVVGVVVVVVEGEVDSDEFSEDVNEVETSEIFASVSTNPDTKS